MYALVDAILAKFCGNEPRHAKTDGEVYDLFLKVEGRAGVGAEDEIWTDGLKEIDQRVGREISVMEARVMRVDVGSWVKGMVEIKCMVCEAIDDAC